MYKITFEMADIILLRIDIPINNEMNKPAVPIGLVIKFLKPPFLATGTEVLYY